MTATQVESPVRQLVYRLKAGGFDAGYEAECATTDEPDDLVRTDLKPPDAAKIHQRNREPGNPS